MDNRPQIAPPENLQFLFGTNAKQTVRRAAAKAGELLTRAELDEAVADLALTLNAIVRRVLNVENRFDAYEKRGTAEFFSVDPERGIVFARWLDSPEAQSHVFTMLRSWPLVSWSNLTVQSPRGRLFIGNER